MKASHQSSTDQTKEITIESITGLSETDAQKRLKTEGYNELPSQKKRNIFVILLHVLLEPMLLLLIGAGLIYIFLGEKQDALMLLFFVFVVVGITFYQQRKTERALEALKNLSSPRALVIRDVFLLMQSLFFLQIFQLMNHFSQVNHWQCENQNGMEKHPLHNPVGTIYHLSSLEPWLFRVMVSPESLA